MIYTVTLNPSLDYIVRVGNFKEGSVNRTNGETVLAGGKGVNVSLVLHRLGCDTIALGFLAGFTGEEIARLIRETGCPEDFIFLKNGFSRINVKLKSREETEINGVGADVSEADLALLLQKIEGASEDDVLVLAGSVPKSLGSGVYRRIADAALKRKMKVVTDAAGDLLREVLPCRPFLVKPNHHELGELFDVTIQTREEAVVYAKRLQEQGAENVLVSMASQGAVLVTKDAVYTADAPQGTVVNSVGAGDSMVAGFLCGFLEEGGYENALRMGIAAGSASAFREDLASKEDVEMLFHNVYIKESKNGGLYKNV